MTEPSTDTSQISSLESDPGARDRKRGRRPRRRTYSLLGWLWESIPGPFPVRLLVVLAMAALAVVVLFNYAFPYAVTHIPWVHDWVVGTSGTVQTP